MSGRWPAWLAVVGGVALVLYAVGVEFLAAVYSPGFGLVQTLVLLLGIATVAQGAALLGPSRHARLAEIGGMWRAEGLAAALRFAAVLIQVVLFALVARAFQLENPAFYQQVIPLVVFGFVVHHLLPAQYRLAFFVTLSLAGLVLVLGEGNALWVVAVVLAFVGISRLPVSFGARLLLVVLLGAALVYLRMSNGAPWSAGIWPVLGSILMFRLVVYLYDLKHAKQPPAVGQTLAYFFLLPNVVFPLFPVVDFATFCRTHYDRAPWEIYQQGLRWLLRGTTHLLLYRIVYQNLTLAPEEVATTGNLVQYLLSTFGLYLRVSGQFHVIIGLLHLFGFRLPETHHLFYLASSFTDFWRRINIYWKDFMMKVVFYPVYFPLRKKAGETAALVAGTAVVFAITWLTHSWQWFWILGSWLLSWTDGLFWAILGVLLVVGSLREMKKGRVRAAAGAGWSAGYALGLGARTAVTFTTICVLWSLWGSHTVGEWLDLISVRAPTAAEAGLIAAVLVLVGGLGVVAAVMERRRAAVRRQPAAAYSHRAALATAAGFALIYLAASPAVIAPFGLRAQEFVRELRVPELSKRDAAQLTRGYYENLTGVGTQNSQLWELLAQRPAQGQDIWSSSGVLIERDDWLGREMRPLFVVFQTGVTFRTNRWGMRDRDYEREPPPHTDRIALLGQSYVAGDGVSDGETFDEIVEDRLNARGGARRTEILNFAVGSYSVLQQLAILPGVLSFGPRLVLLVGNPVDPEWVARHLVLRLQRGVRPPYGYLDSLLVRARVDSSLRETEAMSRLVPWRDSILEFALREFVREVREAGAVPVWVYLATPERGPGPDAVARMVGQARAAGFVVLDWSDVYDGHDQRSLQVSPWDFHPNREGHRVIAERFYEELTRNPALASSN
jgi:hypothetical protein